TLRGISSETFDPRNTVYLPPEARGKISVTNASKVEISGVNFDGNAVRFNAQAKQPAIVSVSQSYYHSWEAFVDGQKTQLFRANHGFQAIEIPPGEHQISLRYNDALFKTGLCIST